MLWATLTWSGKHYTAQLSALHIWITQSTLVSLILLSYDVKLLAWFYFKPVHFGYSGLFLKLSWNRQGLDVAIMPLLLKVRFITCLIDSLGQFAQIYFSKCQRFNPNHCDAKQPFQILFSIFKSFHHCNFLVCVCSTGVGLKSSLFNISDKELDNMCSFLRKNLFLQYFLLCLGV